MTTANIKLIYDDTVRVPEQVSGLTGIRHFGSLLYRRQMVSRHLATLASDAGIDQIVHLRSNWDVDALREHVAHDTGSDLYLYYPSNLVSTQPLAATRNFFQKIRYARQNLVLELDQGLQWSGLALMDKRTFSGFAKSLGEGAHGKFMALNAGTFSLLDNTLGLIDLRDQTQFMSFLTSNFEVRHFNAINNDHFTITKRSKDKAKLQREFSYYHLLPPELQMFFVQPFDFQDAGETASYRMERLFVPDMAIQWVHGALSLEEFASFLDRLFYYIALRPRKTVGGADLEAEINRLYHQKVGERIASLKAMADYPKIAALLASAPAVGGVDRLVERYQRLCHAMPRSLKSGYLCIGHGDLCFSNILYGKSTQLLKLIDTRGATTVDELYADPYYDLAKLSHSILGNYDYINNGIFDIALGNDLGVELSLSPHDHLAHQQLFRDKLEAHGFDGRLVRLYEASLFISMLPLHIDIPKKVLALALNADAILRELESV